MEQIGGDNDMKRILALTLCILTLLACVSPAQAASYVYVRQTDVFYAESYYHKNPNCAFAAHLDPWATVKLIKCSVATAEKNYCRPCPVCAYTFKPVFTGSFPKWTHKTPPYYLWSGNTEEIAVLLSSHLDVEQVRECSSKNTAMVQNKESIQILRWRSQERFRHI